MRYALGLVVLALLGCSGGQSHRSQDAAVETMDGRVGAILDDNARSTAGTLGTSDPTGDQAATDPHAGSNMVPSDAGVKTQPPTCD